MAYELRYAITYSTINTALTYGTIEIFQKDYAGAVDTTVKLARAFSIDNTFEDWDSIVLGKTLEFTIVNDKANYFELSALMYAAERQFLVKVTHYMTLGKVPTILFSGFLDVQTMTQKYLHKQEIQLVASSHLKKLENQYIPNVEIIQDMTFIDIIADCLDLTGVEANIRANTIGCIPYDDLAKPQDTQTFLNLTGVNTELFWENEVDRDDAFTVLEKILKTFCCYLFWWDDAWYIQHYAHLGAGTPYPYVEYTFGQRYSPADLATPISAPPALEHPVYDLPTVTFRDMTQTQHVQVGAKLITVGLNQEEYFNLTINDFRGIPSVGAEPVVPEVREWLKWRPINVTDLDWTSPAGEPYKTITNAIGKIFTYDNPGFDPNSYLDKGLYTTVRLNNFSAQSSLKFNWKTGWDAVYPISVHPDDWEKWEFHYSFFIKVTKQNGIPVENWWLNLDPADGLWKITESIATPIYMTRETSLTNISDDLLMDISEDIKIGEAIDWAFNFDFTDILEFTLCIGASETFEYHSENTDTVAWPAKTWYGDVIITTDTVKEDNVIQGDSNEDFIEEKSYSLDVFDAQSYNFKNGILRGDKLDIRTDVWFDPLGGGVFKPMVDWFLINKFRIFNVHRQRITGTNVQRGTLPILPFTQYDENRDGLVHFLATRYRFYPIEEEYEIQIDEFDISTDVTLEEED